MISSNISKQLKTSENSQENLAQLKNSLPKNLWFNGIPMYLYQGFWVHQLDSLIAFQTHFQALDTDILVTSCRKAGTTWLKALVYSICNRKNHPLSSSPLLNHNPHELVPQLESNIYANSTCPDLSTLKCPRLFGTHVPFPSLPISIKTCKCKMIYIFRNPLDTMISSCMFYQKLLDNKTLEPDMFTTYIDMFCKGEVPFGPFDDHVLGYWKKSLVSPEKVLFVKYEDLKANARPELKRMAEYVGCPFTEQEESKGVIEEIINLCSFEKLKQVAEEPDKSERVYAAVSNESFFRRGVVGDWVNYMNPLMAGSFNKIMEEKFRGCGLTFMSTPRGETPCSKGYQSLSHKY